VAILLSLGGWIGNRLVRHYDGGVALAEDNAKRLVTVEGAVKQIGKAVEAQDTYNDRMVTIMERLSITPRPEAAVVSGGGQ